MMTDQVMYIFGPSKLLKEKLGIDLEEFQRYISPDGKFIVICYGQEMKVLFSADIAEKKPEFQLHDFDPVFVHTDYWFDLEDFINFKEVNAYAIQKED